jgi:type I restriction enzyme S subunit
MSSRWPTVPLGEVLRLQRRWVKLVPTEMYTEIGVRSFGKGIFHKAPISGSSLGNKRVLQIHPGDLVFNNVFAWEGAVAVAGEAEAGKIGSHRFVTYTAKPDRASAAYLRLFFMSAPGLEVLRRVSPGSAGRNRTLNIERFALQQIPLPSPDEQRRLVEWIDALAPKVEEASCLREQAIQEAGALLTSAVSSVLGAIPLGGQLGDVLRERPRNGWSARCDGFETGTPVLSLGAITGFWYKPDQFKRTAEPTSPDAHYWLRKGDLLLTRSNTPELVGHAAIYNGSPSPCIYPDLVMRLDVDDERVDTRFLHYLLQSAAVRDHIRRHAKGTSPTMKKISQEVVMTIPFPKGLVKAEQCRFVEYFDGIRSKVTSVQESQARTAIELGALLPTALDRAFKGELAG